MKKILILIPVIAIIVLVLAAYFTLTNDYYYYKSLTSKKQKLSPTYFIEPSNLLLTCYNDDNCIKVKGSACQPSKGGTETCINKNHMQEYLSNIENLEGKEWEVSCPDINNSTNKTCSCVNGDCKLVS